MSWIKSDFVVVEICTDIRYQVHNSVHFHVQFSRSMSRTRTLSLYEHGLNMNIGHRHRDGHGHETGHGHGQGHRHGQGHTVYEIKIVDVRYQVGLILYRN